MTATEPSQLPVSQKLDEIFKSFNRSDAPGLVVGVSHKGVVIYRRAFGLASLEHSRSLTPATRMRIGSTTKQFCSLGIMLLAEEGKLDIDQPVGTWLPELGDVCGRPSLLQLMHHTGGLHDPLPIIFVQNGGYYSQLSAGGHLQMMSRLSECNFPPGSRFAYSNSGYQLLSLVTERVSGKTWAEFQEERIFRPMGMNSTAVLASDLDIVPNMATLHVHSPEGQWRRGIYPCDENLGGGGIISTVDDMLLWTAHLRSVQKKLGRHATWSRMMAGQSFSNGNHHCYGLGLMRDEHRGVMIIHHAGATMGSTHQMLTAPEHELDIVVMSNRMDVSSPALALQSLEAVLEHEGLGEVPPPVLAADFPAVQGRWYNRASKTLIEIGIHKAHPGSPERLMLSTYNQPVAMLRKTPIGLALPDGPFSTLEIRDVPVGTRPPTSLSIHVCGEPERFERLPEVPPCPESLAADVCGRYRQPGYPKEAEIALRDGRLVFDLLPLHGRACWDLQPYAEDVLGCGPYHAIPHYPLPNGASLSLNRPAGKVLGFSYNTDRIRGMYFERI